MRRRGATVGIVGSTETCCTTAARTSQSAEYSLLRAERLRWERPSRWGQAKPSFVVLIRCTAIGFCLGAR